jgi:hypothetical protein
MTDPTSDVISLDRCRELMGAEPMASPKSKLPHSAITRMRSRTSS